MAEWKSSSKKRKRPKAAGVATEAPKFREVSPYVGMSVDVGIAGNPVAQAALAAIRKAKTAGMRPLPSQNLSVEPESERAARAALLDQVASLVDENAFGRSEMCLQFAELLARALNATGVPAKALHGPAQYRRADGSWFQWPDHAWVLTDAGDLIDGNIDSVIENPAVHLGLAPPSYWGPKAACPSDRKFPQGAPLPIHPGDVEDLDAWWQRLSDWQRKKGQADRDSAKGQE